MKITKYEGGRTNEKEARSIGSQRGIVRDCHACNRYGG